MTPEQQGRINAFVDAVTAAGLMDTIDNIDINTTSWPPTVNVFWKPEATQQQMNPWATLLASWNWSPRRARLLFDIYNALKALSPSQKSNIDTALFSGSPPLWTSNTGPSAPAMLSLFVASQFGTLSNADKTLAKLGLTSLYVLDHPAYLVNPSFDPTINVPGDELVP